MPSIRQNLERLDERINPAITIKNVAIQNVGDGSFGPHFTEGVPDAGNIVVTYDADFTGTATVTGSFGDGETSSAVIGVTPGTNQTDTISNHTYNFADEPVGPPLGAFTASVSISGSDVAGDTTSSTASATVNDFTPIVTAAVVGPASGSEGSFTATITGTFTDPSTDTHSAVVNWGDGSAASTTNLAATHSYSVTHLYLDDNPTGTPSDVNTITVSIVDDDNNAGTTTAQVTVSNVAPTITGVVITPTALNEGDPATLTVSFTDPGILDTYTATIGWADGSANSTVAVGTNGTTSHSFTIVHTFIDDNPTGTSSDATTVSVSLTDDDTGSASSSVGVTVSNVVPAPFQFAASNNFNEGTTFTLSVNFNDPGLGDTHTTSITWGDGSPATTVSSAAGVTSISVTHLYVDDNPTGTPSDVNTISTVVVDDDLGSGTIVNTITVNNVAPSAVGTSTAPDNEGSIATISVTFSDPGTADTFTATINFGDGSPNATASVGAGGTTHTITTTHLYVDDNPTGTPSDNYTVSVTVVDDDTGSGSGTGLQQVNNVAPTVTASVTNPASGVISENDTLTVSATFTDPGILDTYTVTITWGDGSPTTSLAVPANGTTATRSPRAISTWTTTRPARRRTSTASASP